MNLQNFLEKLQLTADIQEINSVLNNPFWFDRQHAIHIIEKHGSTDFNIAISNTLLNANRYSLQLSNNNQIANYLYIIKLYLTKKLLNKPQATYQQNCVY